MKSEIKENIRRNTYEIIVILLLLLFSDPHSEVFFL